MSAKPVPQFGARCIDGPFIGRMLYHHVKIYQVVADMKIDNLMITRIIGSYRYRPKLKVWVYEPVRSWQFGEERD